MSVNLSDFLKNESIDALFITNALGFAGDLDVINEICTKSNIILIEDNCEALGTEIGNKKTGTFGVAGTHSFFVAHHMSTIEGGMVSTDDEELSSKNRGEIGFINSILKYPILFSPLDLQSSEILFPI